MSYALGQTATTSWHETALSAAKAVGAVASDPHLPEVICRVLQLQAIEKGESVGHCAAIPKAYLPEKGIGLRDVIVPLRYYVTAKQHPVKTALLVSSAIAAVFLIGYIAGK